VPSCAWGVTGSTGCHPVADPVALPPGLEESSGVAPGREPGVVWTHNDSGGEPVLWAVDVRGGLKGRVRLGGAESVDWEGLAIGPCGEDRCLYVADTGDNLEVRESPTIYRIPVPAAADDTVRARALPVRLPDGPRDVEALLALPDEGLLLVTKGRNHPVTVYRYPPPQRPGERITLEEVQVLTDGPRLPYDRVTGGAADPEGRVAALRTMELLIFYRVDGNRLSPLPGGRVRLRSLREPQGEAVAFLGADTVVLTSEAGRGGSRGQLRLLRCPAPFRG